MGNFDGSDQDRLNSISTQWMHHSVGRSRRLKPPLYMYSTEDGRRIYASLNRVIIGSDKVLSLIRCQAVTFMKPVKICFQSGSLEQTMVKF